MLDDWQQTAKGRQIAQRIMEVQTHARQLRDLPLSPAHQEHMRHLLDAANALALLIAPSDPDQEEQLPDSTPPTEPGTDLDPAGDNPSPARPLHILLVEDNPFTQKLMTRLLTLRQHRVTLACHGGEALELIDASCTQADRFDLVLMDLRMPVLDGLETAIAIRQREKERREISLDGQLSPGMAGRPLPIIAVTALTSEEDRMRVAQAGMDGFHSKPVQATQLFAEIERLLPAVSADDQEREPPQTAQTVVEEEIVIMELDMTPLLKTVENDWTLLKEIVDLYRMDAPKQLRRIQTGIEQNDAELVREAAHSLKGASANFGDTPIYALALQLEQAGRSRDLREAGKILEQLLRSSADLETALCAAIGEKSVTQADTKQKA
ncbi:MAG: response regulator [Magnetococcus sp. YQC-3]